MFDILELPRELTQNFYDYIAAELYTVAQYFGITSENEPFDVPLLFNGYGGFSWGSVQGQPSASSAYPWGYRNSAVCNINITSNSIDISSTYYRPTSNVTLSQSDINTIVNWYNNFGNITADINVLAPEIIIQSFQTGSNVQCFRPIHNGDYNIISYTPPFSINNPSTRSALFIQSAGTTENQNLPDFAQYGVPYINVGFFSDTRHISTFDSNTFNKNNYTPHTVTLDNGDTFITYSSDYGLILPIFDKNLSWKDLQNVFTVSTPPNVSVTFPSFDAMKDLPFAYIEPIHELNYSLQMPDTSEYLDIQTISKPLSVCADSLGYFWNAITSFGLAPVLGFCLVAALIVKGLRGD